ncbi:MAG TPA: ABC transporter permease [Phycisphaerales bacterium]|nr:ABC transporter permease [Phycisphaerales bacterium]
MLNPFFYIRAILLALSQIWVNKTRSCLTALGIIIGVASVVSVITALTGLKTKVLKEFETFGASKMFIFPDRPDDAPRNKYPWEVVRLKVPELERIAIACPSIKRVTPTTQFGATIRHGDDARDGINITGIWPAWHEIENRQVIIGRPFIQIDESDARQVCIVNQDAIAELHLNTDPTGATILINQREFLIVGVVENQSTGLFGMNTSQSEVFIPFSTARKFQDPDDFFFIIAQATSPDAAEEAKAEISFNLRKMRALQSDEPDTFAIRTVEQVIRTFNAIAVVITMVAGGIVGISLLVGGIGIMNIMLVSVTERTREIGLRKAVGATPAAILVQFLLEAITLSSLGGLIGVAFGELFAFGVSAIPSFDLKVSVPFWAIAVSFAFCAMVGITFGMFPAIKAARLDPIDALRHE